MKCSKFKCASLKKPVAPTSLSLFLELGHETQNLADTSDLHNGRTWNLYGPDRSGLYGGAQGIGGLESTFLENSSTSRGTINNFFGDTLATIIGNSITPYQSTLSSYGAVPGSDVNQQQEPQWRGHSLDETGYYWMGARYYDPNTGRFLSPDPLGHNASWGLYDYCNGDPVNGLDPDGRCVEKLEQNCIELNTIRYNNTTLMNNMISTRSDIWTTLGGIGGEVLSCLDGDLDDPSFLEDRNQALQRKPNPNQEMSINGLFTSADRAQQNANSIAKSMGLPKDGVLPINNYTHPLWDIPRALIEQIGFSDLRSMCLASIVNYNDGGKGTAFSNGSIVLANAIPYMTSSAKAHFEYTGLNPQRYINPQSSGFKKTQNDRNRYDIISILFLSNRFKKWDKTLKTNTYFFDALGNHSFEKNYPMLMSQ